MSSEIILYSASAFFVFLGLLNSFKVSHSLAHIKKQQKNLAAKKAEYCPDVFVLIPVLREAKIIGNSLENFSRLKYPADKLNIVVVTTEKEHETFSEPDTPEVVKTKITLLNKRLEREAFLHIHYPNKDGVKSDQLNYAIEKLSQKFPSRFQDNTYIGVYDADSSTNDDVIELLAADGSVNGWADAYKQQTLYIKNHPGGNILAGSFSLLQTAFAFYHENYNLITASKMRYLIGHGLFVKWSSLKEAGLFPTPVEDTRLGHIFSYLKKDIRLLPSFDTVETAPRITARIRQASVWFIGESYFWMDRKIATKIKPIPSLRILWLGTYKLYRNAVWMFRGGILLILLALLIYKFGPSALLPPLIYLTLPIVILISKLDQINVSWPKILFSLLLSPVEFLFMSLGPLVGFIKTSIFRSDNKNFLFPKTERV